MQTCYNCACDPVCDHNFNGWENCGNWQPIIVRCKDCKKRKTTNCPMENRYDEYPWEATTSNDFCSYGERRADDE